jgi:4-amino-4-deoxychorismate lyase
MHPCFETIQIKDYEPLHVSFHNERFWLTCKEYLKLDCQVDLSSLIKSPMANCRCKIAYDGINFEVDYAPIPQNRKFEQFRIVEAPLDYPYKFSDRVWLDALREGFDDAILVKNGLLLDTTIANIALKIENRWLTPQVPLLKGTTRARLLQEGKLALSSLHVKDLARAQKVAIMNALIGFCVLDNPQYF